MATYVNDRRAIHEGRSPAMIPGPINPVFPKPNGPPVPILNMAHGPGLKNGTATLKIDGKPVSVAGSRFESIPATPDRLGGIAGVRSTVVGGAAEPTSYSSDTKFEGKGSVRSFDTTKSNSLVINPGWAMRLAMKALPGPYDQLAQKVIEKLPGAFGDQLSALGESLTDPSVLIGPALKLVGKLIPGVNLVVGGAAMAESAMQIAELAQEVQDLLTPPLTDEKIDQIADVIANGVAAITIGFVLGKIVKRAKSRINAVASRQNNQVNPNTQAKIVDDVHVGAPGGANCELGTCHPVIFATGVKILSETDFALPGLLPLEWRRFYRSADRRPGWLGWGWSTPLSIELALVHSHVHYYDARGRRVQLPPLSPGQSHFDEREKITLIHHEDGHYSVESTDGLRHEFAKPVPGQWRLPLARLRDRHGNAITLHYPAYDETGVDGIAPRPAGLTDSAGRELRFGWTDAGLLAEVRLAPRTLDGVEHQGGVLVRYAYDSVGNLEGDKGGKGNSQANLASATDAQGGTTAYRYENHLMVAYTTKNGFTHHQQWSRLDAGGRVVRTWTDTPGLLDTRFEYDLGMRTTHVTDALGRRTSYHYNGHNEVVAVTEAGPDGQPVRTETQMDRAGNPDTTTDALGRSTRWQWDARGNLTAVTDAAGATTRLRYNALNLPTEITDALGHVWKNDYDARGDLREHTDALGHATRYQYDPRGLPVAIEDAHGKTKHLQWDAAGQLTAYTDCSGRNTRYQYDILGNLAASIDALGQTTRYQHDALGQLRIATQADGAEHRYDHDAQGNLVAYTDPKGAITRYAYNGLDQPVERQDPQGQSLRYRYDAVGRLVALQNENGAWYQFHYDAADNLVQEIGFDGRIQRYRYNAAGELTELHERDAAEPPDTPYDMAPDAPLPKRTHFQRDLLGRLLAKVHTNGEAASYTYDLLGRMVGCANAQAQVRFAYDALSQLVEETQVHLGDAQADGVQAPAPTQAQALVDRHFTFRHAYDALGNRIASVLPSGKNVQWLYYGSGHLHQIRVDGHTVSDMERDALHQEISRTQGALTSRYGLDPMGRLVAHKVSREAALQTLPGAATEASLRDRDPPPGMPGPPGLSDLLARLPHLPSGHRIARHYQYDRGGNLTATQDSLRGASEYRYDALGRILSAHKGTRSTTQGTQQGEDREQFTFDPAGNLLNPNRGGEQSAGGVSHEREKVPTNRLTVYQDLRFTYDLHGNVVQRLVGWHTVQNYRYSAEHQIVEATVTRYRERPALQSVRAAGQVQAEPGATVQTTRYRYDALGRRVDKTDAFGRTRFVYDGDLLAGEIRGSKVSEYLYEPDSFVPLAKLESEAKQAPVQEVLGHIAMENVANESSEAKSFAVYYYQCDQVGAPQELTDEAGRIVWAASYKVWGQAQALQMLRTGTDGEAAVFTASDRPLTLAAQGDLQALNLVEQPLRFQGQYFDGETGLHYNRYRYYDPVTGRFVHQDPIGFAGGGNFYEYSPNPWSWFDPLGLARRPPHNLKAKVKGKDGAVKSEQDYVSGGMTEEDKALGYPLCTLVTHTERKALNEGNYSPEDSIEMDGQYAPCSHCKGAMNTAVNSGKVAGIKYTWDGKVWEAGDAAKKARAKSNSKKAAGVCALGKKKRS
ncbi:DUF6531 domain-containing protein [Acidovorax sp. SUPP2522]|uniref:DUF6531 domain-containing protein n=1 Tax=Acidovorax sp. SUPP2522 TaxID=511900 RepID=UPI0023DE65D0|nr:DUF6531 domain-containing protein [Acidovorax sp. SUPP2522]GKT19639.1 DUF6531 domain-containing protein [Acidovorax sp. SUPP2522]